MISVHMKKVSKNISKVSITDQTDVRVYVIRETQKKFKPPAMIHFNQRISSV